VLLQALAGILPPVALATMVLLIAWRPFGQRPPVAGGLWASALAVALGFAAGHAGIHRGMPPLPWAENVQLTGSDWLFHLAVLGGLLGAALGRRDLAPLPRSLVLLVASAAVSCAVLANVLSLGNLLVGCFGCASLWWSLDALARRDQGWPLPAALAIAATGTAAAMVHTSAAIAQLAGALAATLGTCTAVAFLQPRFSLARGAAPVTAVLLGGLLLCGHFFTDMPLTSTLLLALAPHLAWLGMLPAVAARGRAWTAAATLAGPLVAGALAAGIAFASAPSYGDY
jgi:hypothetical protein